MLAEDVLGSFASPLSSNEQDSLFAAAFVQTAAVCPSFSASECRFSRFLLIIDFTEIESWLVGATVSEAQFIGCEYQCHCEKEAAKVRNLTGSKIRAVKGWNLSGTGLWRQRDGKSRRPGVLRFVNSATVAGVSSNCYWQSELEMRAKFKVDYFIGEARWKSHSDGKPVPA